MKRSEIIDYIKAGIAGILGIGTLMTYDNLPDSTTLNPNDIPAWGNITTLGLSAPIELPYDGTSAPITLPITITASELGVPVNTFGRFPFVRVKQDQGVNNPMTEIPGLAGNSWTIETVLGTPSSIVIDDGSGSVPYKIIVIISAE